MGDLSEYASHTRPIPRDWRRVELAAPRKLLEEAQALADEQGMTLADVLRIGLRTAVNRIAGRERIGGEPKARRRPSGRPSNQTDDISTEGRR